MNKRKEEMTELLLENARLKAEIDRLRPKPVYLYLKVMNNPGHCPALVSHKFKDANLQIAFDHDGVLVSAEIIKKGDEE